MFSKSTITFLALSLIISPAIAQSNGDFRSVSSGEWNNAAIWETFDGQDWKVAEMYPSSTDGMIYIKSGNEVTLTSDEIIDQLIVAGSLTLNTNRIMLLDGDISVTGSISVKGRMMCGNNTITGTGSFTLSPGATILIGSADGITATGYSGNIQTNNRSFSNFANYVYCGTEAQVTGNGLPTHELHGTFTLDNQHGCSLSSSLIINNQLLLNEGVLCLNGKTLTVNPGQVIAKDGAALNLCGGNITTNMPAQDGTNLSLSILTAQNQH